MAKKNHHRGGSGSQKDKEQHKKRKKAQNGSTSSAFGKRLYDEAMSVKESRRHRENPNSDSRSIKELVKEINNSDIETGSPEDGAKISAPRVVTGPKKKKEKKQKKRSQSTKSKVSGSTETETVNKKTKSRAEKGAKSKSSFGEGSSAKRRLELPSGTPKRTLSSGSKRSMSVGSKQTSSGGSKRASTSKNDDVDLVTKAKREDRLPTREELNEAARPIREMKRERLARAKASSVSSKALKRSASFALACLSPLFMVSTVQ
mmetsp:Transcript_49020/g.118739  ORF Transcript_49020/g.118739 Transcript_49020/m.118739 type:complete len:261 (-) Transcript_49020:572-1354(-)